jgi:hypothetical protein
MIVVTLRRQKAIVQLQVRIEDTEIVVVPQTEIERKTSQYLIVVLCINDPTQTSINSLCALGTFTQGSGNFNVNIPRTQIAFWGT